MYKVKIIALLSLFLLCGCSNDDIKTVDSKSINVNVETDANLIL